MLFILPRPLSLIRSALVVTAIFAVTAAAQPATLLKDLNAHPNSANGFNLTATTSRLFFTGSDLEHGGELWTSDGTQAGTHMVKDLVPGKTSSFPSEIVAAIVGGKELAFFAAGTADKGRELWVSDGSADGTSLVLDINPGTPGSDPGSFVAFGGGVLFTATTAAHGRELWFSAGTDATTFELKDINPGPANGVFQGAKIALIATTPTAIFAADDGSHGVELWRTQGSNATTVLAGDINPGLGSSQPTNFLTMPGLGRTFFKAFDPVSFSNALFSTDGFAVQLVKAVGSSGGPQDLTPIRSNAFVFAADSPSAGTEPWISDGTTAGTQLISDVTPGQNSTFAPVVDGTHRLLAGNGFALFVKDLPFFSYPSGLYVTDGTFQGTKIIADVFANTLLITDISRVLGTRTYFPAGDETVGTELFSSDGTAQGTRLEADINLGAVSSNPGALTLFQGALFFFATTTGGSGLYKTTENGTSLIAELSVPGTQSSYPSFIENYSSAGFAGNLLFSATDGAFGGELFTTDGTAAGTRLVKDINTGSASSAVSSFSVLGSGITFEATTRAAGDELWFSDGTEAGTVLLRDIKPGRDSGLVRGKGRAIIGGSLLFFADDGVHGLELWKTNGTPAGTQLLKDINIGPGNGAYDSALPDESILLNGVFYFAANNSGTSQLSNLELWRSDGTAAGTFMLKDIYDNPNMGSFPRSFGSVPSKNLVLFSATDSNGTELWKSDGTASGTALVKDIYPGTLGSSPENIRGLGDVAVFTATGPNGEGEELWVTDGTAAGTALLRDIYPGANSSQIRPLYVYKGRLFFSATDGIHGREMWVTDGTPQGTAILLDFNPGAGDSNPFGIISVGDSVYFGDSYFDVQTLTSVTKLLKTDGTSAGTAEFSTNGLQYAGTGLEYFRGRLFFSVLDPQLGIEPFTILFDACPDDPAKSDPGVCGCGVPDVDANGNGILDCLVGQEASLGVKNRVSNLLALLKSLKAPKSHRAIQQDKKKRRSINAALTDLLKFARASTQDLTIKSGVKFGSLLSKLSKLVHAALKLSPHTFNAKRKGSIRTANSIDAAV